MSAKTREHMSGIDHAWLRMERPYNLMMITGVMILEGHITLAKLRTLIESRFLSHQRFLQRPIYHADGVYWETDPHFEIASHVRRVGLAGAAGKKELQELVGDLRSTPLDPSKPLWQVHLIEGYATGSVLVFRIHHCYADGIALIHVLLSMTTPTPTETVEHKPASTVFKKPAHSSETHPDGGIRDIFEHLFHPLEEAIDHAVKAGGRLLHDSVDVVTHPANLLNYARHGAGFAAEAARLAVMSDDPQTRYKGKVGVTKYVAWTDPLPLSEVKTIGKLLGCSINDVLLSCAAGALRGYLLEKGDRTDNLNIRTAVPVNLRPLEQAHRLGNYFGLVFLELPLGIADPLDRLYEVKKRMGELKGSYQAILALGLLGFLGWVPKAVQASVLRILTRKETAVITNVPGPQQPLYFGGLKIGQMMFWVPQTGTIGMGVSILSYNHQVQFGLVTDAKLVSDPQSITDRFVAEFEKLLLSALMEPWDQQFDREILNQVAIHPTKLSTPVT